MMIRYLKFSLQFLRWFYSDSSLLLNNKKIYNDLSQFNDKKYTENDDEYNRQIFIEYIFH